MLSTKQRDSNGRFVNGSTSFWKGKKFSDEMKKKLSDAQKGLKADEKHHAWKGDSVGMVALHSWVKRKLGKPSLCEHCGSRDAKVYDWSNISGQYKRDVEDWQRLCRKCHSAYDSDRMYKAWITRRKNNA